MIMRWPGRLAGMVSHTFQRGMERNPCRMGTVGFPRARQRCSQANCGEQTDTQAGHPAPEHQVGDPRRASGRFRTKLLPVGTARNTATPRVA